MKNLNFNIFLYFIIINKASLNGKVIWVTGASAGIGKAIAFELAKAGSKLVLSGTKVDRLNEVKKECLGMYLNANCVSLGKIEFSLNFSKKFTELNYRLSDKDILVLPFNMTNYDEHQGIFNKILAYFGRLDILGKCFLMKI